MELSCRMPTGNEDIVAQALGYEVLEKISREAIKALLTCAGVSIDLDDESAVRDLLLIAEQLKWLAINCGGDRGKTLFKLHSQ